MKKSALLIGLVCIVVIIGCLLFVYFHKKDTQTVSYSVPAATSTIEIAPLVGTSTVNSVSTTTIKNTKNSQIAGVASSQIQSTSEINFEVVTTPAAQQQGLGDRASIPDNYAMLFVFPSDGMPGFWMKDMLEAIDMIWVSDNGTIAAINSSVPADSYPDVFYPPVPIRYVLETRAGFAAEKGWHVGTRIALPLPY